MNEYGNYKEWKFIEYRILRYFLGEKGEWGWVENWVHLWWIVCEIHVKHWCEWDWEVVMSLISMALIWCCYTKTKLVVWNVVWTWSRRRRRSIRMYLECLHYSLVWAVVPAIRWLMLLFLDKISGDIRLINCPTIINSSLGEDSCTNTKYCELMLW